MPLHGLDTATLLTLAVIAATLLAFGVLVRPKDATLTGLRGWLAWFALLQLGIVVQLGLTAWNELSLILPWTDGRGSSNDPTLLRLLAIATCIALAAQVLVTYALFAKKHFFVFVVTAQWFIGRARALSGPLFMDYWLGAHLLSNSLVVFALLMEALLAAIPVLYARRSRRVANTMVR